MANYTPLHIVVPAYARMTDIIVYNNPDMLSPKNWIPAPAHFLLGMACLAYVLSFIAYLAGASNGGIDIAHVFNNDQPLTWYWHNNFFGADSSVWDSVFGSANNIVDIAIIFVLQSAVGYVGAQFLWAFLTPIISIVGWIILCSAVFGKSTNRATVIILLHSLPLLFLTYGIGDVFLILIVPIYHSVAWLMIPWMLYFGARILQGANNNYFYGMIAVVGLSMLTDIISAVWFVAPFVFALFLIWKIQPAKARKNSRLTASCKKALLATAGGLAVGIVIAKLLPTTEKLYIDRVSSLPSFSQITNTIGNITDYFGLVIRHNFLLVLLMAVFFVMVLRQAYKQQRTADPVYKMLLWFVPLSMLASLGGVIATGLFPFIDYESFIAAGGFGDKRYVKLDPPERGIGHSMRYMTPLFFMPLFIGWILYMPKLREWFIGVVALLIAVVAMPQILAMDWQTLNPRSHPFYACLTDAAKRLNAKSVIAPVLGREPYPVAGVDWDSYIMVGAVRAEQGFFYVDKIGTAKEPNGSYEFVISNASGGKFSLQTPGREPFVCTYKEWHQCVNRFHLPTILDGQAIRAGFGEPSEVINCPGNSDIYYYNPPIEIKGWIPKQRFNIKNWTQPADY